MSVHQVAILALDGVIPFDLAIPTGIFGPHTETPYRSKVYGLRGEVGTTGGFSLSVEGRIDDLLTADTIIVPGYTPHRVPPSQALDALRAAHQRGRRMVSICTGAFALAAAGILDGRRATTHWRHADELAADYPSVTVDRDVLYVDEGQILSSAGVCCGIDLCLHIVRRDLGAHVANEIARAIVAPPHRDGGQAQYMRTPVGADTATTLTATRTWALERLDEPLTVAALARHANTSSRSFARRFVQETGSTPLQWLLMARLDSARELLERDDVCIDEIARRCGLGSAANLRLHFRRHFDTTPTAYRRTFSHRSE
ncbi:transcriptional regulator GlxA family with amidase domain [Nocardia kruczakiae]|uniref:Transcriptional regulator GlxA family with amidase domain n=1 Tax=Nocardia kruczakiae TaxID=261477 RepID=A0ABU1XCN7_9NOCA|nr:helix-turn-helix domain-containing protein [Nocardia kruczakiae]MDR7168313.1 transcriptional regulator GlxA family with amidase domain [Nocardia kruczakiae]